MWLICTNDCQPCPPARPGENAQGERGQRAVLLARRQHAGGGVEEEEDGVQRVDGGVEDASAYPRDPTAVGLHLEGEVASAVAGVPNRALQRRGGVVDPHRAFVHDEPGVADAEVKQVGHVVGVGGFAFALPGDPHHRVLRVVVDADEAVLVRVDVHARGAVRQGGRGGDRHEDQRHEDADQAVEVVAVAVAHKALGAP